MAGPDAGDAALAVATDDQFIYGYAAAASSGGATSDSAKRILVQAAKSLLGVINSALTNSGKKYKAQQVKIALVAAASSAAKEVDRTDSLDARAAHSWCKALADHMFGDGTVPVLPPEGQKFLPRPVAAVLERQDAVVSTAAAMHLDGVPLWYATVRAIDQECGSHPDHEQIKKFIVGDLDSVYGKDAGTDFLVLLMGLVERLTDGYRTFNG